MILEAISSFFTALFGAGFGALAAYWFANRQSEERRYKDEHAVAISTLYVLIFRSSAVENFCRGFLTEDRQDLKPELTNHLLFMHFAMEDISYSDLTFLVDSKDSQFLYDLRLSESSYFNFVDAVQTRNELHGKLLASSQHVEYDEVSGSCIREGDPALLSIYSDQNAHLAPGACRTLKRIFECIEEMESIIRRRFPDLPCPRSSIQVESDESAEQVAASDR